MLLTFLYSPLSSTPILVFYFWIGVIWEGNYAFLPSATSVNWVVNISNEKHCGITDENSPAKKSIQHLETQLSESTSYIRQAPVFG